MQHCRPVWLQPTAMLFKGCLIMLCSGSRFPRHHFIIQLEGGREGSTVKEQGSAIINRTENSYKTAGLSKHGGPCSGEDHGSHEDLGSKLSLIVIFVRKPSLQAGIWSCLASLDRPRPDKQSLIVGPQTQLAVFTSQARILRASNPIVIF